MGQNKFSNIFEMTYGKENEASNFWYHMFTYDTGMQDEVPERLLKAVKYIKL